MKFIVEIRRRLIENWRLQADGTWRRIEGDAPIEDTDRMFDALAELHAFQQRDMEVSLGGERVTVNATGPVRIGDQCGVHFWVIRDHKPHTPTKDELQQVICNGDDRYSNTLVINLAGHFELRRWTGNYRPARDLDVAVRMETFAADNEYVGPEAAADHEHIDRTYRQYLWLWRRHIESGLINLFEDGAPGGYTEETVLAEVAASLDSRFGA